MSPGAMVTLLRDAECSEDSPPKEVPKEAGSEANCYSPLVAPSLVQVSCSQNETLCFPEVTLQKLNKYISQKLQRNENSLPQA